MMWSMVEQTDDISTSPLVSAVVSTLTERIRAGQYLGKEGLPSERDLAEEFGVSRTLIRRVLTTLETQNLILRAPRCRTMVREPMALVHAIRKTRRSTIGLGMLTPPYDPGTAAILHGINQTLNHDDYRLVIGSVVWNSWEAVEYAQARFLEQMMEDQDIVGVLLWYLGGAECVSALRRVLAAGIPIVFMDRRPPAGIVADYVGVDNIGSAEQVIRHLVRQGHRQIAHISNAETASTVSERMLGYRRALEQAGIPFRPELVVTASESCLEEVPPVYAGLAEQLLSLPEPPTAVFAVNDVIAQRFMGALRIRGLHVPDDIAVAGFDGIERLSHCDSFLTTAYQPFELMGKRAADLLLQRIVSGPTAQPHQVLLQAPLRIHGSTLSGVEV